MGHLGSLQVLHPGEDSQHRGAHTRVELRVRVRVRVRVRARVRVRVRVRVRRPESVQQRSETRSGETTWCTEIRGDMGEIDARYRRDRGEIEAR